MKGFCLHPLIIPSYRLTNWFQYPWKNIRTKFNQLDASRQTAVILASIFILISIILCLIIISLRQIFTSRSSLRGAHENIEYVMLQNVDENDGGGEDNDAQESKFVSTNGHTKAKGVSLTPVQEA